MVSSAQSRPSAWGMLNSESILVGITTRRGRFRLHLAGDAADLKAVGPTLDRLAGQAEGPDDFLVKATPELARHHITIADVLDIGPQAPQLSIAERIRMIMNSRAALTAEDAYPHLLATFQIAEPEEIEDLLRNPSDLSLVAEYINSVLADLDENRARASAELRGVLGEAAYVILGPSDE